MPARLAFTVAAVLTALALAACAGGGRGDGYVSVGTGDTYGEWELFAELHGGEWTGCLRLEHVDGRTRRCAEPEGLVRLDARGVAFGAFPDRSRLVFAEDRHDVGVFDDADVDDFDFYVVSGDAAVELIAPEG